MYVYFYQSSLSNYVYARQDIGQMIFTALQILEKPQKYATVENGKISRNVPGQEANRETPLMKEDRINENNKRTRVLARRKTTLSES